MTDLPFLRDHLDLCAAKARYCRFLDTKDWAAWRDLMTEDYELDISEGTGIPVIHGRDAAIERVRASIGEAKTAHQVHTPEINIEGDTADVIWAMQDRVVFGAGRPSITGYGHYHERWVRRDGEWKLAALKLTRLHLDLQPAAAP